MEERMRENLNTINQMVSGMKKDIEYRSKLFYEMFKNPAANPTSKDIQDFIDGLQERNIILARNEAIQEEYNMYLKN